MRTETGMLGQLFFRPSLLAYSNCLLFLVILLLSLPSQAMESMSLNLQDALHRALQNNASLAASRQRVEEMAASVRQASGRLLPQIRATSNVMRSDSPNFVFGSKLLQQNITAADFSPASLNNPSSVTNWQHRIEVRAPVWQGGSLWAMRRASEQQSHAARQASEAATQDVLFAVIRAYSLSLQADAMVQAAREALAAAKAHEQSTENLLRRGMAIQSDAMDAQVHLLQAQVHLHKSLDARDDARDQLRRLLNLPPETRLELQPIAGIPFSLSNMNQAIMLGLSHRPELQAKQAEEKAADAGIHQTTGAFLPHFSIVAATEWNNGNASPAHRNTAIGGIMEWNLFAGGSNKAAKDAAIARKARIALELEDLRYQIRNEITQAWRAMVEAKQRLTTEIKAEHQARESLRIQRLRHRHGLSKTSDLLTAQAQVDATRAARIRARYDALLAQAYVLRVTGLLTPEVWQ